MLKKPKCPVIAIEEHYSDPEMAAHFTGVEAGRPGETHQRLLDLGALRIKDMDDAGIDIQVLSQGAPGGAENSGRHCGAADAPGQRPPASVGGSAADFACTIEVETKIWGDVGRLADVKLE
jgi:hypothetical protein